MNNIRNTSILIEFESDFESLKFVGTMSLARISLGGRKIKSKK